MNRRNKLYVLALGLGLLGLTACDEDITSVGESVIGGEPFTTGEATYNVFAYNKKLNAVQTNKLPVYQLGTFDDPVYGETEARITSQVQLQAPNPIFGSNSQDTEDSNGTQENERVTSVYLYLPYLVNETGDRDRDGVIDELDADPDDPNSDTDEDGVTDSAEKNRGSDPLNPDSDGDGIIDGEDDETAANRFPNRIAIDSIYGNRDATFGLKVWRSTFFLRDEDPDTNFETEQLYFSTRRFNPEFLGELLYENQEPLTVSNEEILIFEEDDPETPDVDESETGEIQRFDPGIRVELDPEFFQRNLIDKEGQTELLSMANFKEFFRGIHLEVNSGEPLMFLFDLTQANITVNYEYDREVEGETVSEEREITLSLLQGTNAGVLGNAVNSLVNTDYPQAIAEKMDTGENADRIYLKGGAGSYAEIQLFEEGNRESILEEIRRKNWIVNEARLVFYVDREALANAGMSVEEPPRLYIFNTETLEQLYDPTSDNAFTNTALGIFSNHDGVLVKQDGTGFTYTIRITEYINDLLLREETNVTLGLTVTADIRIIETNVALNTEDEAVQVPEMSIISPLGTVLHGSATEDEDKRLKLELFYTEIQ